VVVNGELYDVRQERMEIAWNTATPLILHYPDISYSIKIIVNDGEELWIYLHEECYLALKGVGKFIPWPTTTPPPPSKAP
jgi:hypothetical protein